MTGQFKILISSLYNKKQFTNSNVVKEFKILINKYEKFFYFFYFQNLFKNPSPQTTEVEQQSYSKNY